MPRRRTSTHQRLSRRDLSRNRLESFKKEYDTDSHIIPLDQLCRRLETNTTTGLTKQQAKEIFAKTGPNALTPSRRTPECVKFIKNLFHGFSILMWIGALLCFASAVIQFITGNKIDSDNIILGSVLISVVLITGIFMYYQEHKSSRVKNNL